MSPVVRSRTTRPARRACLALLVLATAAHLAACGRARVDAADAGDDDLPARPSIVLVLVDDWALSDLEAARADAIPANDLLAVDLLASIGQSWTNFYAQPTCNPTRSTLMHGRLSGASSGGICNPPTASTPTPDGTLATILRDAGYATAAFGKWHVARDPDPSVPWTDSPAVYGFDAWRAWNASNLLRHCGSKDYFDWHRVDDGVEVQTSEYHTEAVGNAFVDWWQATSGPRLAYVCFQAPHAPFHDPPPYLLPAGYPTTTSNRERYDAMLVALDTMLAAMLNVIDLRDTYVFVLGDNGTPPDAVRSDQVRARVKPTTFEDGVNVPLVVAGPGIAPGTTEALGHVVDLAETLAALAGATHAPGQVPDSRSLVPVLFDATARVRDAVVCDRSGTLVTKTPFGDVETSERTTCAVLETPRGLVKGMLEHVEEYDAFTGEIEVTETEAYFDLEDDPRELRPLDPEDPTYREHVARLRELLDAVVERSYGAGR